jgi:hypothetical protein
MTFLATAGYHKCPKTDCPRDVPDTQYACPRHWFQVSAPTRRRILRTWSQGEHLEHAQAMSAAALELNGGDV